MKTVELTEEELHIVAEAVRSKGMKFAEMAIYWSEADRRRSHAAAAKLFTLADKICPREEYEEDEE